MKTDFQIICDWMKDLNSTVALTAEKVKPDVIVLCKSLIAEETKECLVEIDNFHKNLLQGNLDHNHTADLMKELGDVLVVVYFMLNSLGVNGSDVYRLVMDNNCQKTASGFKNEVGKLMVPPEVKARLKKEIHANLIKLIER
jgi:NTP pyrophosphatase (non-canonical NTP hydrolase)